MSRAVWSATCTRMMDVTERLHSHDDSNLIWHYTSLGALIEILRGRSLRATEVRFQNDPHEALAARNALAMLLRKVSFDGARRSFDAQAMEVFDGMHARSQWDINEKWLRKTSRFILCASNDGDSLYAWRTYGSVGNIGCAIGLDRSTPLGVIGKTEESVESWEDVIYAEDDLDREFLGRFREFADDWRAHDDPRLDIPRTDVLMKWLDALWPDIRTRTKHPSYLEEKEARVTVLTPEREAIDFADGRFGPRPFVQLGAAKIWGMGSSGKKRLPIRSLRLAPDAPDAAFESARWLLAMHGYLIDGELREPHYDVDKSRKVHVLASRHAYRNV